MPTTTRAVPVRRKINRSLATVPQSNQSGQTQTIPADAKQLMALVLGSTEINVDIPKDATLSQVETTLGMVISGYKRLSEAAERIKPIVGRILLTISTRRLYRPEYRNLTDYIERKVEGSPDSGGFGLSRTNAFEALRIARAYPTMSVTEYEKYGASILLVSTPVTDQTDPRYKEILDDLSKLTVAQAKVKVREMRALTGGDQPSQQGKSFVLSFRMPLEWKEPWESLLKETKLSPSELFQELIRSYIEDHPSDEVEQPQEEVHAN